MEEMSVSKQRARDLVPAYGHSLEQQIVGRGSNLVCRDEELWTRVEGLLKDGDAQETHCLGLDPLRVMEESLAAAAASTTAAGAGRVRTRGGLQGLAKAFEVLEQAALNLYLGPWRDEYKVVKMYSGMFTHFIKPVMSMPQIEKLFGLLGYRPSSSRHEQLRLQSPRVGPASLDDLLCLSCAFFLARCECFLLRTALGKHAGEAQWELSVVRERQRGNCLQVALDNTKKTLGANPPQMEPYDGDAEVDLYTDEHVNGGQREAVLHDDESPHSLTWVNQSTASPPAARAHSNRVMSLSSSTTREHACVSKLDCQLTKSSSPESDPTRSFSAGRCPRGETWFDKADSQWHSLQVEATGLCKSDLCSCDHMSHGCLGCCVECKITHHISCASLQHCFTENHRMVFSDSATEEASEFRALSLQGGSLRLSNTSVSPTLSSGSAAMSSLALCDDPKLMMLPLHPIAYHDCCDLAQLDPQALCISCGVFHTRSCRERDFCQRHHDIRLLGVCSCGRECSRKPLVLCRYCGNEYCRDCWYRNPVACSCGQTFDQSSPV
ncbi:spermatogenesis associated 2-like [Anarrhichthys ocellatus]|uniref:spermatogenesis associated 2-like n=1 Tax=Anarrhichthys ocellatus TaxID=433405 RepID=UPI0012EE7420|nr:spermatogenesis-associated protein 2-like protein [Anarrhichthys ocellatus]